MIKIDALGKACPIPVVMTRKAINALTEADKVETLVDNEIAVQNLTKMANQMGYASTSEQREEKVYAVTITVDSVLSADKKDEVDEIIENCEPCTPSKKTTVVAIGSDCMGSGDDKLGATLMKGFIYAVSGQDTLPDTMLFFNGGAKLTVEGSPALEDLKAMEEQGVEILTCGTCLDFYGLKEKLAVGGVTNMYVIVEKMSNADKVIRN